MQLITFANHLELVEVLDELCVLGDNRGQFVLHGEHVLEAQVGEDGLLFFCNLVSLRLGGLFFFGCTAGLCFCES